MIMPTTSINIPWKNSVSTTSLKVTSYESFKILELKSFTKFRHDGKKRKPLGFFKWLSFEYPTISLNPHTSQASFYPHVLLESQLNS
jgi:hypothetical protein